MLDIASLSQPVAATRVYLDRLGGHPKRTLQSDGCVAATGLVPKSEDHRDERAAPDRPDPAERCICPSSRNDCYLSDYRMRPEFREAAGGPRSKTVLR